jgi:hypothetical protein
VAVGLRRPRSSDTRLTHVLGNADVKVGARPEFRGIGKSWVRTVRGET